MSQVPMGSSWDRTAGGKKAQRRERADAVRGPEETGKQGGQPLRPPDSKPGAHTPSKPAAATEAMATLQGSAVHGLLPAGGLGPARIPCIKRVKCGCVHIAHR